MDQGNYTSIVTVLVAVIVGLGGLLLALIKGKRNGNGSRDGNTRSDQSATIREMRIHQDNMSGVLQQIAADQRNLQEDVRELLLIHKMKRKPGTDEYITVP
jgi:hypothetical protein